MRKVSWRALEFLETDEKSVAVMTLRGALDISERLAAQNRRNVTLRATAAPVKDSLHKTDGT